MLSHVAFRPKMEGIENTRKQSSKPRDRLKTSTASTLENGDSPSEEITVSHPVGYLHELRGSIVRVKLNSGHMFKGLLHSVDGFMNVAIENCREFQNGEEVRHWGDAFLRGNTVTYIAADKDITSEAPVEE
ncbi:hypothetical protein BCR34DRAFT_118989 [Clohesyomyces aquaticus]|uniref:U6 snRNA-associated Sm-like protein LSm6 n=1 Tax=Clohesyomyces aquaticus TaxID=1231657 RepID=A0A1Y2A1F2_9PLEO|nr:hypothetical protein BCR34DRAFT_118989 [Clohesyomyces aquaticus]